MTGNKARTVLSLGAAICLLPLVLTGCGTAGSGTALNNSASLAPASGQGPTQTASLSTKGTLNSANSSEKTSKKSAINEKALKQKGLKKKGAIKKAMIKKGMAKMPVKSKAGDQAKPVLTAKADAPPVPTRRPHRVLRRKKTSARMINGLKPAKKMRAKTVAKLKAKPLLQQKAPANVKSVVKLVAKPEIIAPVVAAPVVPAIVAKAPAAQMVPAKSIPAQHMPTAMPQDILDAFNETPTKSKAPEKMAKAESVPIKHSFGQSEHRFAGQ